MAFGFAVVFVYDDFPLYPSYAPPPGLPQCQPPYFPDYSREKSPVGTSASTIAVSTVLALTWAAGIPSVGFLFHHYRKNRRQPVDLPVMEEEMEKLSSEHGVSN